MAKQVVSMPLQLAPAKHMLRMSGCFGGAGARSHCSRSCATAGSGIGASISLIGITAGAEKPPFAVGSSTCTF